MYVEHDDGTVNGPFSGSSYPDSKNNTDNSTSHNTLNEGEHLYNNESGHKGGTKQGLNVVNESNVREAPGTDPNGSSVTMTVVNFHKGASDNGNYGSRGSAGCLTISPTDAASFFDNFDWSGANGKTGTSSGTIVVRRGESDQQKQEEFNLQVQQLIKQFPIEPEVIDPIN